MSKNLSPKQKKLVAGISKGLNIKESALLAGYSDNTSNSSIYTIMRSSKMVKALNDIGIGEEYIAKNFKRMVREGIAKGKPSQENATAILNTMLKLQGYLTNDTDNTNTNTNIHIKELRLLNVNVLKDKLKDITKGL